MRPLFQSLFGALFTCSNTLFLLSVVIVALVIDPTKVTKRKRTLQRGPAGAKKSKSGEGASVAAPPPSASADVPLPSEQSKEGEFGSFVELMGALPSDPRPPSSQEAGLLRKKSKRPIGGPSKEVAIEVAPLRQIPFSPPPSNFSCD